MNVSTRRWPLLRNVLQSEVFLPALSGCFMSGASISPWITDPLGENYSAWNLPVDIGWQVHTPLLNYGVLCLGVAGYAFLVALASYTRFRGSRFFEKKHVAAGMLCLLPVLLFLWQYLFVEQGTVALLAQHKLQALLVQSHFRYGLGTRLIKIVPFTLDISTVGGRLPFLIDVSSLGTVLPLASAFILIGHRWTMHSVANFKRLRFNLLISIAFLFCIVLLGRAPAAMICEYIAQQAIAVGDYTQALTWLDKADALNPALEQVAFYHLDRGQAVYFLHPDQHTAESDAYIASTYLNQSRYLEAYQLLYPTWQSHPTTPWITDQLSMTIEKMAEHTPALSQYSAAPTDIARSIATLQLLTEIDRNNIYGIYTTARLEYELNDYNRCITHMFQVIGMSSNTDIQSSAYTYMALSDAGLGDYVDERTYLLQAVTLDPQYRNGTAREELSGLH